MKNEDILGNLDQIPILYEGITIQPFDKLSYLVVNNKDGHYLKVSKLVADALLLSDGTRSLKQIHNELGESISFGELANIFSKELPKFGILESTTQDTKINPRFSHIKLKITLIPIGIVDKISRLFCILFHPAFMIFSSLAFVFLFGFLLFMNFQFINTPNTEPAYRSHWWIWIVLSFLVGLFHEFGHSSALVNFGGKPRQIGFGLYLIFPMFFSTVTDAWRFKKKERLLINLGGVYFEMLVAMLGLIYFIIFHDLSVLIFCFFYLITILYNLNPFIRSDGYWILSDMTNTPNLTQLSNENLKLLFSKSICRFKLKNYLLALYALLSKTYIAFIILALFVNNYSQIILFFPNLVNGISTLRLRGIGFTDVQKAIPVILFYLLLINFISDKSKLLGARLASK